jgi:hypothetical protein
VPSAVLGSAGELQCLIALRTTAEVSVTIIVAIIIPVPVGLGIVIVVSVMVGVTIVVAISVTVGVSIMVTVTGAGDLPGIYDEISTASTSDPNAALIKSPSLVLSACRLTPLPLHAHAAAGVGRTVVSAAIFGSAGDDVLRKARCGTRDKKCRQNELRNIGVTYRAAHTCSIIACFRIAIPARTRQDTLLPAHAAIPLLTLL